MPTTSGVNLHEMLAQWPIRIAFLDHLPVGDLISLARTNSSIRAALHNFDAENEPPNKTACGDVRPSLHIGSHQTPDWKQLKEKAAFVCSSSTHTKGLKIKPCHYCSRPICEACIVRSSFANPRENTFQHRCRSFCKTCWTYGNKHKRQKFPAQSRGEPAKIAENDPGLVCECTLKTDGWICLECKHMQNTEDGEKPGICFGEGCSNELDDGEANRRRICMWCDRPLPPPRMSGESRRAWNQKLIDARLRSEASRQADYEEYQRKRQKQLKMSRRELRGNDQVVDDLTADIAKYVRHLDTVNYQKFLPRFSTPTGDDVYKSKLGKWQYDSKFLLAFRDRCTKVPVSNEVKQVTKQEENIYARTNQEKYLEAFAETCAADDMALFVAEAPPESRLRSQWQDLRAQILRLHFLEHQPLAMMHDTILTEYGFDATPGQYGERIEAWCTERANPTRRTRSGILLAKADKQLAKTLQKALDREAAEALQAELYDEESDADEGAIEIINRNETRGRVLTENPQTQRGHLNKRRAESDEESQPEDVEDDGVTAAAFTRSKRRSWLQRSPSLRIRAALLGSTLFPETLEAVEHQTDGTSSEGDWEVIDESEVPSASSANQTLHWPSLPRTLVGSLLRSTGNPSATEQTLSLTPAEDPPAYVP